LAAESRLPFSWSHAGIHLRFGACIQTIGAPNDDFTSIVQVLQLNAEEVAAQQQEPHVSISSVIRTLMMCHSPLLVVLVLSLAAVFISNSHVSKTGTLAILDCQAKMA
jgi:hypothetical protein